MSKITSTELKKHFADFDREKLLKEILELFQNFSEVREFYQSKLSDDGDSELCEKYKRIIKNEFFPTRGYGKARLSIAKKAVMDFKKISRDVHSVADIMIYYAEMGVDFTNEYGDINESFYYSMVGMFDMAAKFVTENQIADKYKTRFEKMVKDTSGIGWGFPDELEEIYQQYFINKEL